MAPKRPDIYVAGMAATETQGRAMRATTSPSSRRDGTRSRCSEIYKPPAVMRIGWRQTVRGAYAMQLRVVTDDRAEA